MKKGLNGFGAPTNQIFDFKPYILLENNKD